MSHQPVNKPTRFSGMDPILENRVTFLRKMGPSRRPTVETLRIVHREPSEEAFNNRRALRYSMGYSGYPQEAYLDKPATTDSINLNSLALITFALGFIFPPTWLITSIYALPPNSEHNKRRPAEVALGKLAVFMLIATILCITLTMFGQHCWIWYYPKNGHHMKC